MGDDCVKRAFMVQVNAQVEIGPDDLMDAIMSPDSSLVPDYRLFAISIHRIDGVDHKQKGSTRGEEAA